MHVQGLDQDADGLGECLACVRSGMSFVKSGNMFGVAVTWVF